MTNKSKSIHHRPMLIVYSLLASLLTVCLNLSGVVDAQATTTLTETRFVTQTSIMSNDVTCAKVVNVTGICRRRRGFKIDTPVVLIFDETMDIDLEQPSLSSPTQTLSVEPTAVAKLPSGEIVMAAVSDVIESSKRARRSDDDDSVVVGAAAAADDRETLDLDLDDKQNRPPRFPFLNALFSGIISNIVNNRPNGLFANLFGLRSTVSVTQTQVISTTVTFTTGNLNSFFIMGCTPSPFPHLICTSAAAFIRKRPPTS